MRYLLALLLLPLAACTSSGAIHQVGPDTYQITHTMGRFSPTTGVRAAITEKAQNKCAKQNQTYSKVREEMGFASGLSYTLIFRCTTGQGA